MVWCNAISHSGIRVQKFPHEKIAGFFLQNRKKNYVPVQMLSRKQKLSPKQRKSIEKKGQFLAPLVDFRTIVRFLVFFLPHISNSGE